MRDMNSMYYLSKDDLCLEIKKLERELTAAQEKLAAVTAELAIRTATLENANKYTGELMAYIKANGLPMYGYQDDKALTQTTAGAGYKAPQQVAELEKDRARLDWLEAQDDRHNIAHVLGYIQCREIRRQIDNAIDAAKEGEKE